MRRQLQALSLAALLGVVAMPALAQTPAPAAAATATDLADGEVRKIDKAQGKLTIRHGEIKNLDMPPMTMVFRVSQPALLDKLQPGDKIRFRAIDDGGKYTVTEVVPVR